MRTKRFLLVTAALSAATATAACGKNPVGPDKPDAETLPLPANPKGSFYDANVEPPPPPPRDAEAPSDAGATKPPPRRDDAGAAAVPTSRPLPANPKGSHYDSGPKTKLDF